MRLTTEHSMSSYGIPIFVDENNFPIDYADGVRQLRQQFCWSVRDLADHCGASPRTVEGWEQGRLPSKPALLLMQKMLD
jgi:DNA-binding transcriptional regulator YiaG